MWPNPQETPDLITFTEEILNGKLYFLCSIFKAMTEIFAKYLTVKIHKIFNQKFSS